MHVYYAGSEGIHGEILDTRFHPRIEVGNETVIGYQTPTLPFNSALCRATWDFDRLYALVPSAGGVTIGEAVTRPARPLSGHLVVNALVKDGGSLRVELLNSSGQACEGYTLEDCQPLTGDHTRATVRWKGGDQAPPEAVKVRFVLHRAFLYGYEWDGSRT